MTLRGFINSYAEWHIAAKLELVSTALYHFKYQVIVHCIITPIDTFLVLTHADVELLCQLLMWRICMVFIFKLTHKIKYNITKVAKIDEYSKQLKALGVSPKIIDWLILQLYAIADLFELYDTPFTSYIVAGTLKDLVKLFRLKKYAKEGHRGSQTKLNIWRSFLSPLGEEVIIFKDKHAFSKKKLEESIKKYPNINSFVKKKRKKERIINIEWEIDPLCSKTNKDRPLGPPYDALDNLDKECDINKFKFKTTEDMDNCFNNWISTHKDIWAEYVDKCVTRKLTDKIVDKIDYNDEYLKQMYRRRKRIWAKYKRKMQYKDPYFDMFVDMHNQSRAKSTKDLKKCQQEWEEYQSKCQFSWFWGSSCKYNKDEFIKRALKQKRIARRKKMQWRPFWDIFIDKIKKKYTSKTDSKK